MNKIDAEMKETIEKLNGLGIKTLACCSGHGIFHKTVFYQDTDGKYYEWHSGIQVYPVKRKYLCFYEKDKHSGLYFNPAVEDYYNTKYDLMDE
jgi:hypothetical protein